MTFITDIHISHISLVLQDIPSSHSNIDFRLWKLYENGILKTYKSLISGGFVFILCPLQKPLITKSTELTMLTTHFLLIPLCTEWGFFTAAHVRMNTGLGKIWMLSGYFWRNGCTEVQINEQL